MRLLKTPELKHKRNSKFRFLSYGGRNVQKRVDLLIKAALALSGTRDDFEVVITKGTDTEKVVNHIFNGDIPGWLRLIEQTDTIVDLLSSVDCFVSTSVHETFSYAVAEASVFGLPVIQSDIDGTMWNASNPSTFLFQSENVEDLACRMRDVIDLPKEDMRRRCEITRLRNVEQYSFDMWVNKIVDFLERL